MSSQLRSKQGCWTCRLRKKKCDEGRPHCSTCKSLSITCYGFGPKPDWMDNGENERAVANSIKGIVKHTSRRKATTHFPKQRDSVVRIAPKFSGGSVEISSSGPWPGCQHSVTPPSDHGPPHEDRVNVQQDGSADSALPERDDHLMAGSTFSISTDEFVLLMHFLDNVFPLQYPLYKPCIAEGGRGWLLALLLRTEPLYHVALALSAYHRRMVIHAQLNQPCRVAGLVQQEKHLEICIKAVSQFAKNPCPNRGLGIATAVVQLAFFELFTGNGSTWQAHLRAGMNMYQRGFEKDFDRLGLAEESRIILCDDLPLSVHEPRVAEEVVNFRFLVGTMIWLDITSSITAGTAPNLLPYHLNTISSTSQIKLEDIMGCKNWVLFQIGRIAALHEHIAQALQHGHCDFKCAEFDQIADDIRKEIQYGLPPGPLDGFDKTLDPLTLVTHIFAHTASVYLHLVMHGFHKLEMLHTAISEAMRILQTHTPVHLLPALISPLYVIGSVAEQGDQQFFRNIFSSLPLLDPSLNHRGRILPVLEEIWIRRQTTPLFAWRDSLELTHDMLLI